MFSILNIKKYYPKKIHIETIFGCNSKCIMCPNSKKNATKIKKMDRDLFEKIIKGALKIKTIKSVKLSLNGEALLDDDICSKIRFIKSLKNIRITFNTNAFLLTPEISNNIIASGLDRINFHVSGFSEKTYGEIMRGLSFKKTLENIINFRKISKEKNSKIIIALKFVVLKNNLSDIKRAEKFCKKWGLLFRPDILNNRLGAVDIKKIEVADSSKKIKTPCSLIFDHIFVKYNGDIVSCWSDWYGSRVFGNCQNDSLLNIYNSKKINNLRAEHLNDRKKSKSVCSNCNWKEKDAI